MKWWQQLLNCLCFVTILALAIGFIICAGATVYYVVVRDATKACASLYNLAGVTACIVVFLLGGWANDKEAWCQKEEGSEG